MPQNNSQSRTYYALAAILVVAAFSAAGWYFMKLQNTPTLTGSETASSSDPVGDAIAELIASGATSTSGDGFTVEVVPETPENVPTPPSLTRSIPKTPDLDAEGRRVVVGKIEAAVAALKADSSSYADWMDLGTLRLVVKDYEGAKQAWEYAAVLGPNTATPYGNLGDLHANYLREYSKAEANFKIAIERNPKISNYYRPLYELYLVYKPTPNAAENTLKDAISKFPTQLDFYVLLARYYRDQNRTADAKGMYDTAISVAERAGNVQAASQLRTEKTEVK